MTKILFFTILATLFWIVGCQTTSNENLKTKEAVIEQKFDAPLRMKIQKNKQLEQDETLACLMQLQAPPTEIQRQKLEEAGLQIIGAMTEIVAVSGKASAFYTVAGFDFVLKISLSQKLEYH